jgi:hypothetical protein
MARYGLALLSCKTDLKNSSSKRIASSRQSRQSILTSCPKHGRSTTSPHGEEGSLTRPQSTSISLQLPHTRTLRQWQVNEAELGRAQGRDLRSFTRPRCGQGHDTHVHNLQRGCPSPPPLSYRACDCTLARVSPQINFARDNVFANLYLKVSQGHARFVSVCPEVSYPGCGPAALGEAEAENCFCPSFPFILPRVFRSQKVPEACVGAISLLWHSAYGC